MSTITGTMILSILKGVAKTPQDSQSAERGIDGISLLDPNGFSCDEYLMKIPTMKNSAVYADSPITDGRTLISGALGNVNEIIRLTLTSSTIVQMAAQLSKLGQLKQDCRDFWSTFGQIEPVFIKHQVDGEPGPRFALLYDIDIDIDTPVDPSTPTRVITLNIEREYGWRGIAPGDNPKRWNCYRNNIAFTISNSNLRSGTQHTVTATIGNKQEFNTVSTFLTNNFVDIPAASLPGDLPPLLCFATTPTLGGSNNVVNLFLAKSTKPTTLPDRSGSNPPRFNSFPGSGATLGTDATLVNDATLGIVHTPVSALARYASVSFATATDQIRLTWVSGATFATTSIHNLRGRYRILLRGEQNGGALGNISVHLNILNFAGNFFVSPTINPKITVANNVQINDLGIVTFPPNANSFAEAAGGGAGVGSAGSFTMRLYAARATGAATLRIYDIILIPIDEGAVYLLPIATGGDTGTAMFYDNTGYFMHGKPDVYASGRIAADTEIPIEPRGNLELSPGVNNRIYLLGENITAPIGSDPSMTFSVFVNIVPRWSAFRDV